MVIPVGLGAAAGKAAAGKAASGFASKAANIISKGIKAGLKSKKKKKNGEDEEESGVVKLVGAVGRIVNEREAAQRRKIKEARKGAGIKIKRNRGSKGAPRQGFAP